jgi:putative colanic acid biosynthesis acetyltransferase WcaF
MAHDDAAAFYRGAYANGLSWRNRFGRLAWTIVWQLLFRLSPTPCHGFRQLLLRAFGARLAHDVVIHPSARIWAPWNLRMAHRACLGQRVNCYNVAAVEILEDAVVSEGAFLCTASHDIHDPERPLVTGPITIGAGAWVFAEAFVGMNVTVGRGAIIAARAVAVRDVPSYAIVAGNPAKVVGERRYKGERPAVG